MEPIKSDGYSVFFDDDLSALKDFVGRTTYSRVFFITDLNTSEHCLPFLLDSLAGVIPSYDLIEVDPGEENKNIDFCIGIWRMLLDFGADRDSLVVNVGGGVVTDMGGFAASTFKRGIDFIHVPTTLLSQVDASVGGKTGIDMGNVKNSIGTFTQPKGVFISSKFLTTLSRGQLVSGFAEVVKHGLIRDSTYFSDLADVSATALSTAMIYRSVQIKNEVVTADPLEKGLRKTLNFGHTIGHAVESYSLSEGRSALLHGEAIAIGMICESYLSYRHNGLMKEELDRVNAYVRSVFPDYILAIDSYPELLRIMKNDKKNTDGKIGFALLKSIGECSFNHYLGEDDIVAGLEYYRTAGS